MSTMISAAALEAYLAGVESGRIDPVEVGMLTLDPAQDEIFAPSLAEEAERVLDQFGPQSASAGIEISAAAARSLLTWLDAATVLAGPLQDLARGVRAAAVAGGAEPIADTSWLLGVGLRAARHVLDRPGTDMPVRLTAADVRLLQAALGEVVVLAAEMELDIRAWRLRRRSSRGYVRDIRREDEARNETRPAPARPGDEPVSECLEAAASFLGEYRGTGVALAEVTVVELEALIRDMAGRARQVEAAAERRADVIRAQRFGDAVTGALQEPGSNVELFPVVRRPPPRGPASA